MSQLLLFAHNISLEEFADQDYLALYTARRRDSNFAAGQLANRHQFRIRPLAAVPAPHLRKRTFAKIRRN